MNEASEEMRDFIEEVTLWIAEQMGGSAVLSLDDVELIDKHVTWFTTFLIDEGQWERLYGLLGRAGFEPE